MHKQEYIPTFKFNMTDFSQCFSLLRF